MELALVLSSVILSSLSTIGSMVAGLVNTSSGNDFNNSSIGSSLSWCKASSSFFSAS